MSEDLIKRSDAIDALKNALCELGGDEWGDGELGVHADDIDAVIKGIPSADVIEPKRGEWIDFKNGWKCNACEKWNSEKSNFCPNCGAEMRGADDE